MTRPLRDRRAHDEAAVARSVGRIAHVASSAARNRPFANVQTTRLAPGVHLAFTARPKRTRHKRAVGTIPAHHIHMTYVDQHQPEAPGLAQDALLTTEQVSVLLAIPSRTLTSWRSTGRFSGPPFVRLGGTVRYRRGDVDEWVAARVVRSG